MTDVTLKVKRLTPEARLPVRAYLQDEASREGSAGYDLFADLSQMEGKPLLDVSVDGQNLQAVIVRNGVAVLNPGLRAKVPTGCAMEPPPGTYGRVAPRSGHADRHGLEVLAGVCDRPYRDEYKVILKNGGSYPFYIRHGERIAQLVLERIETPRVEEVDDLGDTERGTGGFGSSGA